MSNESEDQLMKIHVRTLFDLDAVGHLLYIREPWGTSRAPPRFYMGRTLQRNVWHFRHDLPDELVRRLEMLCKSEPRAADFMQPPAVSTAVKATLQANESVSKEERGPAFLIRRETKAPRDTVLITKENTRTVQDRFSWIHGYILGRVDIGPVAAVVVKGSAVSICYCARLSSSAAEAGVETLEAMRGMGYATKTVARWASAIYDRGLLPLYSTSWENLSSLRVAHKLGAVCYGEDWWIE